MKILFNVSHPANYYLFKNCIDILVKHGHEVQLTAIDKDVMRFLLNNDDFAKKIDPLFIGVEKRGLVNKGIQASKIIYRLICVIKDFHPDVLVGGCGNLYIAIAGRILNIPSIIFDTNEPAKLQHLLTDPFASVICTPSSYEKNLGHKQIKYNGYHELAYLHPNYFKPNPSVLDELNIKVSDIFIIIRLVSWNAVHDTDEYGINNITKLVQKLETYGRVFISSECALDGELERYRIQVNDLHSLLYYATLYIGEGTTVASECAVLGTHAIYINTRKTGYTNELERDYGLIYCFSNKYDMESKAIEKSIDLLHTTDLKQAGIIKRRRLLSEKIDVTAFMVWFIEEYPRSVSICQTTQKSRRQLSK